MPRNLKSVKKIRKSKRGGGSLLDTHPWDFPWTDAALYAAEYAKNSAMSAAQAAKDALPDSQVCKKVEPDDDLVKAAEECRLDLLMPQRWDLFTEDARKERANICKRVAEDALPFSGCQLSYTDLVQESLMNRAQNKCGFGLGTKGEDETDAPGAPMPGCCTLYDFTKEGSMDPKPFPKERGKVCPVDPNKDKRPGARVNHSEDYYYTPSGRYVRKNSETHPPIHKLVLSKRGKDLKGYSDSDILAKQRKDAANVKVYSVNQGIGGKYKSSDNTDYRLKYCQATPPPWKAWDFGKDGVTGEFQPVWCSSEKGHTNQNKIYCCDGDKNYGGVADKCPIGGDCGLGETYTKSINEGAVRGETPTAAAAAGGKRKTKRNKKKKIKRKGASLRFR